MNEERHSFHLMPSGKALHVWISCLKIQQKRINKEMKILSDLKLHSMVVQRVSHAFSKEGTSTTLVQKP